MFLSTTYSNSAVLIVLYFNEETARCFFIFLLFLQTTPASNILSEFLGLLK